MEQIQRWFERFAGFDPQMQSRLEMVKRIYAASEQKGDLLSLPACWRREAKIRRQPPH